MLVSVMLQLARGPLNSGVVQVMLQGCSCAFAWQAGRGGGARCNTDLASLPAGQNDCIWICFWLSGFQETCFNQQGDWTGGVDNGCGESGCGVDCNGTMRKRHTRLFAGQQHMD